MKLVIFGAQGYALGAYEAVRTLYPEDEILFFMVSLIGNNAPTLAGLPVRETASVAKEMSAQERQSIRVLIATPDNVQPEIEKLLDENGFPDHKSLDSDSFADLVKRYHEISGQFKPLQTLPAGSCMPGICIYMARSHKDRVLKNNIELPKYVNTLQVGKACCEETISKLTDDTGDNISAKNSIYSELTGLYWIWKNRLCKKSAEGETDAGYFGLAQYRRMILLSADDLSRLKENDIDVVLPYPLPYEPDINAHHQRYLKEADWDALILALKKLQPEYAECFPKILSQRYLYNYNVVIAKKEVLADYCSWLFPVLERVEELSDPKGCDRSDRYIGYMGETLETLYFMKNADRLKTVHAECRMLV